MTTTKIYDKEHTTTCDCCKTEKVECKAVVYGEESVVLLCGDCLPFLLKFLEDIDVDIREI